MGKIERPYIVYSLPTSRIWQPLKSRKVEAAYHDILLFLKHLTNTDPELPEKIGYEVNSKLTVEDATLKEVLSESTQLPRKGEWQVNSNKLRSLLNYFEGKQKFFKNTYDERMHLFYCFYLTNPSTNQVLEEQQLRSLFTVYFSKTLVCIPTLFFPFSEANNSFWRYLDSIQVYLPFTLDEKFLRLARLKDGRPTSFKKISR